MTRHESAVVKLTISLHGAADGVTGSRTVLRCADQTILVDCGLFQGPKEVRAKNWEPLGFAVEDLDAVLLTHAHLDHSGYLPRLVKQGYRGPIFCSLGTAEIASILLRDAAYLEEEQASFAIRLDIVIINQLCRFLLAPMLR